MEYVPPENKSNMAEIKKILDMNDRILAMNLEVLKRMTRQPWVIDPESVPPEGWRTK